MAKKIVRLTENQLHDIISESVNQILNEISEPLKTRAFGERLRRFNNNKDYLRQNFNNVLRAEDDAISARKEYEKNPSKKNLQQLEPLSQKFNSLNQTYKDNFYDATKNARKLNSRIYNDYNGDGYVIDHRWVDPREPRRRPDMLDRF